MLLGLVAAPLPVGFTARAGIVRHVCFVLVADLSDLTGSLLDTFRHLQDVYMLGRYGMHKLNEFGVFFSPAFVYRADGF